ncbi:bifunctional DNA primase/polymerase [Mycobacteroides abscessus]|uniref:bifunctional DNA primase/polymerase n=1 Tax=Mycobacteroides abscessus TaxID=36809 RepID=UPI000929CEB4|nr:bifunctional DNA primase/polymerase [Mycobacteroides abscessus]SIN36522.1 bifunctional DNA primase/polymerase domain protein [Mycobacteroides abscessus subsp. abscessus]
MSETFEAFLAARPQLVRDSTPLPGLCHCPDRYSVDDRPIVIRHTVCDNTPGSYSWVDLGNEGGPLMRSVDLEALAAWIPAPPPAPSLDPGLAVFVIRRMLALGFHLVRLHAGTKKPIGAGWNDPARTPALTEEEALAHVLEGGNLGVLLGPSNLIVVDAENRVAVKALIAAGLQPVLITAKGSVPVLCDPRIDKRGGAHVWLRVPEQHRGKRLTNIPQAKVGDGGLIDVLAAPGSMAVVPPTALIAAGGHRYVADGGHQVWHAEDVADAPEWLFDPTVGCPAGLESLHGGLAEKVRERGPVSESAAELSSDLDEVPWAEVLALDPQARLEDWGDEDPECGCTEVHFRGATHRRSAWLHECGRGTYAHFVSDTAMAALGLSQRTVSKAQLAAALLGVPSTGAGFRAVAKRLGVDLGDRSLSFADQLDAAADVFEDRAADPAQCTGTVSRPDPAAVPELVSVVEGVQTSRTRGEVTVPATADFWRGEASGMRSLALLLRGEHHHAEGAVLIGAGSVVGAPVQADPSEPIDAETVELPSQAEPTTDTAPVGDDVVVDETIAASSSPSTALAVDDAIQGEVVEDWEDGDQAMWRRHREIEAELRGERDPDTDRWTGMVPCLGRMASIAESRGIYLLGFVEACLPRVSARVPANVLLTPRADGIREKAEGVGMGYNSILLGPPATGKTTTQTAAAGAVPLPQGIRQCATGSAEGVIKKARSVGRDGEQKVHAVSVYVETDEIKSQLKDLKRDGSMYSAFINSAFFGGTMVGMAASEASRNADIPAHSTRFGQQIGAQPQLCGPLLDDAGSGLTARFSWAFTGSVDESALGPLYGRAVPALLPDGLPWDPPTGIPFGFRPYSGPAAAADDDEVPVHEIENIEALPAEWIVVPRDPEEVAAARAESARRSRRTRAALTEDRENGRTSGHDFVRIEKTAALLAFMDGIKQPTKKYVAAAKLLAEATALAAAEAKVQSDSEDEAKARRGGHLRGIEHLHGNAVAKQEGVDAVEAAADALYAKLTRPVSGVLVKGKLAKGFGGSASYGDLTAAKSVRPEHRPFREAGIALLIQQERITVSAVGTDRRKYTVTAVGATGQLAAAPAIGSLNA